MSHQQPISPQLSNDQIIRSFNEAAQTSNQSSFLHPQPVSQLASQPTSQLTPQPIPQPTGHDLVKVDPTFSSYLSTAIDSAVANSGVEQSPTTPQYPEVSQSETSLITPLARLSYRRAKELALPMQTRRIGQSVDSSANVSDAPVPKQRARVQKTARRRKRPRGEEGENKIKLEAPLSILTKHLKVGEDTEKYVNRSIEERILQNERKHKNKVPRPMNSFILYRRAYMEKTKQYFGQNNHQYISQVVGSSWSIETPEVKAFFDHMAQIETRNHKNAYPNYKFMPNKNGNPPKRQRCKDGREDDSDLDDDDECQADSLPFNMGEKLYDESLNGRTLTSFTCGYSEHGSHTSTPFEQGGREHHLYPHTEAQRSSWASTNPGRPVPGMLSPLRQNHYYQPSIHRSAMGPNIEDVTYRRMNFATGLQYGAPTALTNIPPGAQPELLQPQPQPPQDGALISIDGVQVDPQLLQPNGPPMELAHAPTPQQPELWQVFLEEQPQYLDGAGDAAMRPTEGCERLHIDLTYRNPAMDLNGRELWGEGQVSTGAAMFEEWMNGQPS